MSQPMRPKIRILYVIDSLVMGGVESQLVALIERLDRERFDPHVLVLYGAPVRPPHFLDHLRELGVPVTMLNLGQDAAAKLRRCGGSSPTPGGCARRSSRRRTTMRTC